jgi:hypothetical protein
VLRQFIEIELQIFETTIIRYKDLDLQPLSNHCQCCGPHPACEKRLKSTQIFEKKYRTIIAQFFFIGSNFFSVPVKVIFNFVKFVATKKIP